MSAVSEHHVTFEDLPLFKLHGVLGWRSREAPGGYIIQGFYVCGECLLMNDAVFM